MVQVSTILPKKNHTRRHNVPPNIPTLRYSLSTSYINLGKLRYFPGKSKADKTSKQSRRVVRVGSFSGWPLGPNRVSLAGSVAFVGVFGSAGWSNSGRRISSA